MNMKNEGKGDNFWIRIKNFFKKIFKKDTVKKLPEKIEEESITTTRSKDEYINMYKEIKEKKINVNSVNEEDLRVFIQLAKQELLFINKMIEHEKTIKEKLNIITN